MPQLPASSYASFPFRVTSDGVAQSERSDHVREQIEQVLFTNPRERVFRPEFGAGIRRLIFEPNNQSLWNITRRRLNASLADALYGEVDPKTIEVRVEAKDEMLLIYVSYMLAAIGRRETQVFSAGSSRG